MKKTLALAAVLVAVQAQDERAHDGVQKSRAEHREEHRRRHEEYRERRRHHEYHRGRHEHRENREHPEPKPRPPQEVADEGQTEPHRHWWEGSGSGDWKPRHWDHHHHHHHHHGSDEGSHSGHWEDKWFRHHHHRDHDDHDDNDDGDDSNNVHHHRGPRHLTFPFLFPQPVEFLGGRLEMINEVAANLADRLDFLQEIRIVFACPSESCIDGCPETEELRQQAGCIVPREATPLQSGPEGESVVLVEVVIVRMPSPEDIQIMHEMLKEAQLAPMTEPTEVMNAISEDEYHNHDHHYHHHRHHRAMKILCIVSLTTLVILASALCCCCSRKRSKQSRDSEGSTVVMQAIPIVEEANLDDTFVFDPVIKPLQEEQTTDEIIISSQE
eukprot:TRINITY_DN1314_c0_g2_i1.p1 TRINITY_DN1314_c0_g2~~TRINITY_DN1314_c0_g2_i1.p1  ORF type:complete len:398 (+),score=70.57 TRINITY_DN1314_c0_g2_i1:44-1195(+)